MARTKKTKISSKTPSPAFDAHIAAYWTNALASVVRPSTEAFDAHIATYWASTWANTWASTFSETIERLEHEDADALADDLAAALDANPDVIRTKLRTLFNNLYQLNDPSNDWWDETQRAEAVIETAAAFAETLEDLSPGVRRSQRNRKRQAEIEVRWVELDALIRAELDAATAAVRERRPRLTTIRRLVDEEIQDRLRGKGIKVGIRRIRQVRKGR